MIYNVVMQKMIVVGAGFNPALAVDGIFKKINF